MSGAAKGKKQLRKEKERKREQKEAEAAEAIAQENQAIADYSFKYNDYGERLHEMRARVAEAEYDIGRLNITLEYLNQNVPNGTPLYRKAGHIFVLSSKKGICRHINNQMVKQSNELPPLKMGVAQVEAQRREALSNIQEIVYNRQKRYQKVAKHMDTKSLLAPPPPNPTISKTDASKLSYKTLEHKMTKADGVVRPLVGSEQRDADAAAAPDAGAAEGPRPADGADRNDGKAAEERPIDGNGDRDGADELGGGDSEWVDDPDPDDDGDEDGNDME
ncbi:unnamed protein product [Vitrella brassicaformis CCMP3155]|uniref:Uncharacterized protein n=2 Tax=Vitrella brassicaformis TaxID=1169539 RepID=A0A0G4GQI8_VITBC|nr:unnamed protein product [Vitrella brassicaformis CCMP3155]|eukprot:CEM32730.1 unnamed protein product [Vitrella brassicaformis CCMP3155]